MLVDWVFWKLLCYGYDCLCIQTNFTTKIHRFSISHQISSIHFKKKNLKYMSLGVITPVEHKFCFFFPIEGPSTIYSNTCTFSPVKMHIVVCPLGEGREHQNKLAICIRHAEFLKSQGEFREVCNPREL